MKAWAMGQLVSPLACFCKTGLNGALSRSIGEITKTESGGNLKGSKIARVFWFKLGGTGMEARQLLKDKRFWVASFIIAWAAALQGHMMWLQRQDSFKQKFGTVEQSASSSSNDSADAREE